MSELGDGGVSTQGAPETEIVPSTVTKRNDLSAGEIRSEAAAHHGYWQHLAIDPEAQQEVKAAMLARAAADTAVSTALAEVHLATAEEVRGDADIKKEAARKQRLENDRIEDLKEQNRPFVKFTLKYLVRGTAGFLILLGFADGVAGYVRVLRNTGAINITTTGGLMALGIVIALAPSAVAAIIGKIKG